MTERSNRKLQLAAILLGLGAAAIAAVLITIWIIDFVSGRSAAPGVGQRYSLVLVCVLTLFRFSSEGRKQTPGRLIGDALLPFVAIMSILWFVRTGNAAPFGYPAIFPFMAAWLVSATAGFALARHPLRRKQGIA